MKLNRLSMQDFAGPLAGMLSKLDGKEVIIIGDIGIDEYTWGQVRRISPEAPVPVLEVDREESRLGLAANVAQNVSGLLGVPKLISVVGDDESAGRLRSLLREAKVEEANLIVDKTRPTTRKLRVMAQSHHLVRIDYEQKKFLSSAIQAEVLNQLKALLTRSTVVAVVIQDYAKGVISEELVSQIIKMVEDARKKSGRTIRLLADPYRTTPLSLYKGIDLMTPNLDESIALTGIGADELRASQETLSQIGAKLMATLGSQQMIITRGKDGMRIFENGEQFDLPTNAQQVFDVTGAGDTVIAALALAWGSGLTLLQASALANFAAGVVVGKVGCVPCTIGDLEAVLKQMVSK